MLRYGVQEAGVCGRARTQVDEQGCERSALGLLRILCGLQGIEDSPQGPSSLEQPEAPEQTP